MSQANIAFCDLCGKPYEVGGQIHGAELMADVFVKNFNVYRARFQICLDCLEATGLLDIIKRMNKQKEINERKIKGMSKVYLTKALKFIDAPTLLGTSSASSNKKR